MADLKVRLLPNRPSDGRAMPTRPLFQGMDFVGLKKRGQGTRSWIRIDTSGNSQVLEVDKSTIMRRCDLPARDLRLLDPLFVYPSTILGREKAIVVNLEQIRCIITADEVLLLNSLDNFVLQYVTELQRRLTSRKNGDGHGFHWRSPGGRPVDAQLYAGQQKEDVHAAEDGWQRVVNDGDMFSGSSADDLPFEFRALEVAVEAACTYLDTQATELEEEAYPVLDELTSKISTLNLERVRRLKSRLVALTRRVQKVRDEIEHLMDDDGDMAEMYLTEKKQQQMEMFTHRDQPLLGHVSAPVSPVSSPDAYRNLERTVSFARSRHEGSNSSGSSDEQVQELEMLLEAYFVVIDGTLNKLTSLKEYIDDTEDFINIQLDNVRNQLIQFELLLTTATFVVAIFGVVAGVFGMNIPIGLFDEPWTFKWVLIITGLCGLVIFVAFLVFFKHRRLLSL